MSNADLESITHLQIRMPAAICGAFYAPTLAAGWQHALTLPREITWSDGRLLQNPLPEFVDNSMVEIYINDGEYVMTSRFYFPEESGKAMKDDGNREFSFSRRKMPVILTSTGFLC